MLNISHKHLIDEPSIDIDSVDSIDIGSIDQCRYNKPLAKVAEDFTITHTFTTG